MPTINQELRKRAMTYVMEVEQELDTMLNRLRQKWVDWYEMYRTFENQEALPGQSNIFIPKIFEIIEKKAPAVVANDPKFIITPRANNVISYMQPLKETLQFWWEEDEMQDKIEPFVKDGMIYGVSIGKVGWHQEFETVETEETDIDEETDEVIVNTVEEELVVLERPTFEHVEILNFKIDPRVSSTQEGIGCFHIINNQRLSDLLTNEDTYDLSEITKNDQNLEEGHDDKYHLPEKRDQDMDKGINLTTEAIDKGTFTVKEFWGVFSETEDGKNEKEYVITAVWQNGKMISIVRVDENEFGFRPFTAFKDRIVAHEFYAIGEVEPLEGPQIAYNTLRNQMLDYNNAINYPEWIYNVNAGINPVNLLHKPNNLIPLDVPIGTDVTNVLRPVDKPTPPISSVNQEAALNRDFQTVSQTIDFTDRGGSQGFSSTATGIKSRDTQAGIQVNNVVRHLEKTISDVGKMWIKLAQVFVEDEGIVIRRKRGEDELGEGGPSLEAAPEKFTKLEKSVFDDIQNNFTVKVEAGSTTEFSAAGRAQDAVNIGNLAAQFLQMGVPVNSPKVFTDILKDSFQKSNPETYLVEAQPEQPGLPGAGGAAPGGSGMETFANGETPQTASVGNISLQPSQPSQF